MATSLGDCCSATRVETSAVTAIERARRVAGEVVSQDFCQTPTPKSLWDSKLPPFFRGLIFHDSESRPKNNIFFWSFTVYAFFLAKADGLGVVSGQLRDGWSGTSAFE